MQTALVKLSWRGADADQIPAKLDAAIVFAPSGEVVPVALGTLDRGGTMALDGIHMTSIPSLDYDKFPYGERDIHPVTANTRVDGRELFAEVAAAAIKPHTVIYPLRDANRALLDMKSGRIDGTGVLTVSD